MSDKILLAPAPIATQLRALRGALGLSLAETARRAGTSAPTLHRYESGWDRFELRTLRRLAAALDARVEVRLVPTGTDAEQRRPAGPDGRPAAAALVRRLGPLFWDHALVVSDLEEYPEWVMRRVLMYGRWGDVRAIRRYFGDERLWEASRHRSVDARTRNYWRVVAGEG